MASFDTLFATVRETPAYKQARTKLDLTRQIESRMRQLGINKTELAQRSGKSKAYVTKMLRGENNFTIDSLVALAETLQAGVEIRLVPADAASEASGVTGAVPEIMPETA